MTQAFGEQSEKNLIGVHPNLVRLFRFVNQTRQCTILNGGRTIEQEEEYVKQGLSHTMNSKHLKQEDGYYHAVDVAPDPVNFEKKNYNLDQIYFAGYVMHCAEYLGIKIRYGGDWDRDSQVSDESFQDLDHFEI